MTKRGMLLIDRGSREKEASDELAILCDMVKKIRPYDSVEYCFLEVLPPFIEEGVTKALKHNLDELVLVPYFLYPGKKVKAAVTDAMKLQKNTKTKFLITRPMSMHPAMSKLVRNRISTAKNENGIELDDTKTDVLIIGHGSKDPNAAMSIQYVVDSLKSTYRNVTHCFLEIEKPNICQGVSTCEKNSPKVLVIVFYFLHKGAHVKRDIYEDLNPALDAASVGKTIITKHIGADEAMANLICERAREVEDAD
ncbi:MAG: cobalamin biosynthesis CbiX protein [Cenarchaeum symbiont of Oopsacas minuta]|nr:cobalamin biosynthesis CbiX protein [Cenarchaeum symbiont of Oopsacas minuta]